MLYVDDLSTVLVAARKRRMQNFCRLMNGRGDLVRGLGLRDHWLSASSLRSCGPCVDYAAVVIEFPTGACLFVQRGGARTRRMYNAMMYQQKRTTVLALLGTCVT